MQNMKFFIRNKISNKIIHYSKLHYSGMINSSSLPLFLEEDKKTKVKLQGGIRSLYKVAYAGTGENVVAVVNDLSSKFEFLSVVRKWLVKPVEDLFGKKEACEDDEVAVSGSSISPQQDNENDDGGGSGGGLEDDSDDDVIKLDHFEPGNDGSNGPKYTFKLPGKIERMLYPHQWNGLEWLWFLHCQGKGGILADDMGLGKTMQICAFLAGLFHSGLITRVLVVAPQTILPHWIKELSIVGLSEKTREYSGTSTKAREHELQYILQGKGVLLTTYDIVRKNSKSFPGGHSYFDGDKSEDGPTWDYIVLDEGHLIKNPNTQRAKSLLKIPSTHRIIISGTPLQNNLKELWALINFCCPELLGDYKWYKKKFESPILRGNDKKASDRKKRIGSLVAKELRDRIQPYFLRRLKNEVFNQNDKELSQKQDIIVWLRLTSIQRHLYEAFLRSEIVVSGSAFGDSPLTAISILKKICDHPLLLTKRAAQDVLQGMDSMLKPEEDIVAEKLVMHIADVAETDEFKDVIDDASCKISFIMSLLDNLIPEGHSVLIFSQTRMMLNLIQENLKSKGYDFLRMDGTTKASDRKQIVNDFQYGIGAPIFLLTSKVGGLGLTLTRADRVILVDPAWNPSTDSQSVDRAHRIGQKKDVIVYRLMTCGTVEEVIYKKQVYKGGLFKAATENGQKSRYFDQQDLYKIFSLPEEGFDVSVTQRKMNEEHDLEHERSSICILGRDDTFKAHLELIKSLGIAGVSHHNLLFSKTEPAPADEVTRMCSCGEELWLMTSNTTINPGRRFWRCPNWMKSNSCGFFEWYD